MPSSHLKPSERPRRLPWSDGTPSTADATPVPAEGTDSLELAGATASVATAETEALGQRMESVEGQGLESSLRAGPTRVFADRRATAGT